MCCGCERESEGIPSTLPAQATPRKGGELIVALQSEGTSLDPHAVTDAASMRLIENMHATLLRYAQDYGETEPDLARRIDLSADGLQVTIHLRPGARFHSGREVAAEDVIFSIERIRRLRVRADQFAAVERMDAPDPHTVRLYLSRPAAPLMISLSNPMNAIVDAELVKQADDRFDSVDAGAGPFQLVEWRRGRHLKLKRFDGYYLPDRPRLDRLVYRPIADETSRSTALLTGQVHLMPDVPVQDVDSLRAAPGVEVRSVSGTFWEYIGLNTRRPPLDDARVRQAVAWAIDRELLNRLVKFGHATVLSGGHIPPNHWARAEFELYPRRDIERARGLLADAGLPEGFDATLKVGSSFPYQVLAAEAIKQMVAEAGIRVHLRSLESSVFFDALARGDFDMTVVGWVGLVDPDEWTWNLFHSEGKWNQQGYANPVLDGLLDEGRRTPGREDRRDLYARAQRIIADDAPMVFLYVNDQIAAMRRDVRGFEPHATASLLALRDVWLASPSPAEAR